MSDIKIDDKSNWLWTPAGKTKLTAALNKEGVAADVQQKFFKWLDPLGKAYGPTVLELLKKDPKLAKLGLEAAELKEAAKKVAAAYVVKFKLDKGTATITVDGNPFATKKLWRIGLVSARAITATATALGYAVDGGGESFELSYENASRCCRVPVEVPASTRRDFGSRSQESARSTPFGSRSIRFSNTSAAPCGLRSPRSEWRSVATEKPNRAANCTCVRPMRVRTPATSKAVGR